MPQSRLSSVIPFAAIGRPACPKCKAQMMLVSIEPARAQGVDLQTFECAAAISSYRPDGPNAGMARGCLPAIAGACVGMVLRAVLTALF
jgi:hypothetical protein